MTTEIIGCRESECDGRSENHGENKIRRMPVVNDKDQLVGVVSMADIAQEMRPCINSIFDDIAKAVK